MSTSTHTDRDEEVLREVIEHISMAYVRLERLSEKTYHTPRIAAFEHVIAQAFKAACEIEEELNDGETPVSTITSKYDQERLDAIVRHLSDAYSAFALVSPEVIVESPTATDLENLIFSAQRKAHLLRAEQRQKTL